MAIHPLPLVYYALVAVLELSHNLPLVLIGGIAVIKMGSAPPWARSRRTGSTSCCGRVAQILAFIAARGRTKIVNNCKLPVYHIQVALAVAPMSSTKHRQRLPLFAFEVLALLIRSMANNVGTERRQGVFKNRRVFCLHARMFDVACLNEQPSNKLRLHTLCHGGE